MAQLSTKVRLYLESKDKNYDSEGLNFYLVDNGSGPEIGMWEVDDVSKPTDSQLDKLESEADSREAINVIYAKRKKEYPAIGDQLDMQYWDQVNGTTTWEDAIAKVKTDNPKPE